MPCKKGSTPPDEEIIHTPKEKKTNTMRILTVLCSMMIAANSFALSPEAEEGKTLFPACDVCHNPSMDPPLGPPMWGVKRQYQKNTMDEEDFVETMVDFVRAPSEEKVIHKEAFSQLGLMPPMPLPDDLLKKIATYILEEQFPPPCDHWRIAADRARAKGDLEHAAKDLRQLNRFCE